GESYADLMARLAAWRATLARDSVGVAHGGTPRGLVALPGIAPPQKACAPHGAQGGVYGFAAGPPTRPPQHARPRPRAPPRRGGACGRAGRQAPRKTKRPDVSSGRRGGSREAIRRDSAGSGRDAIEDQLGALLLFLFLRRGHLVLGDAQLGALLLLLFLRRRHVVVVDRRFAPLLLLFLLRRVLSAIDVRIGG